MSRIRLHLSCFWGEIRHVCRTYTTIADRKPLSNLGMIELITPVEKHFNLLLFEDKHTQLIGEKRKAKLTGNDRSAYCNYGNTRGGMYLRELVEEEMNNSLQKGDPVPPDMMQLVASLNGEHCNDMIGIALHLWRESDFELHTNLLALLETDMYKFLWKFEEMNIFEEMHPGIPFPNLGDNPTVRSSIGIQNSLGARPVQQAPDTEDDVGSDRPVTPEGNLGGSSQACKVQGKVSIWASRKRARCPSQVAPAAS